MTLREYLRCEEPATLFECFSGKEFVGCCLSNDEASVCNHGCAEEDLDPAFFNPDDQEPLGHSSPAACDSTHGWFVCEPKPSDDQPFVGCYVSSGDPCNSFDIRELGSATSPPDDAGAASSTDAAASFSAAATTFEPDILTTPTPSINGKPHVTHSQNSSTATPVSASPTVSPASDASTGVIAGGAIGGIAAVAVIAALVGFVIMYLRRRKDRPVPDKQLKDETVATEGATNQASNQNEKSANTGKPIQNSLPSTNIP